MDHDHLAWQPVDAEGAATPEPAVDPTIGAPAHDWAAVANASTAPVSSPKRHGLSLRRVAGTLLLAGGLLGIGGVSVVMAASPTPSAATSPSTSGMPSHPHGSGAMPGGCTHAAPSGSNGTSGSATNG